MLAFDGHNDALSRLHHAKAPDDGFRDGDGHLTLASARAGGLAGGFFAIFPCSPFQGDVEPYAVDYARPPAQADALHETLAMASRLLRLERALELRIVRDAAELDACLDDGALAAVMHLEGAEPLREDLTELDALHAAGLRSLGLVWSRPNRFGHGTPFEFPGSPDQGPGLTDAGRALVKALGELNVLIDVSHLNGKGFWDVAELSDAPLVASHSNAHALCPSPRNLTDDQLRAIGERGGVAGLNFHVGFVRADGRDDPHTPLADLAAHAAHIAEVAGVDALALGSDFDGGTPPNELADAARLPALFDALRAVGFADEELERIALGNWRRVLRETWGG